MRYAASGKSGNYQEIAAVTNIPTGESSGKAPAILDYCRGMGLVQLSGKGPSKIKQPELTPFGRIVFKEDPFLKERITQWIAHFNLCGPQRGADVWFHTFFSGGQTLSMGFTKKRLEEYLAVVYGTQKTNFIGPLLRMYEEESSFRTCGVLTTNNDNISRQQAPTTDEFGLAYSAWILQLIMDHFSEYGQVTVTELDSKAGLRAIPGWDIQNFQRILNLVEQKGTIEIDRHMNPWILRPKTTVDEVWVRIYEDLI